MPLRDYRGYLFDIIDACQKIKNYSEGLSLDDQVQDDLHRFAIERALTIAGEALAQARQHFPEINDDISHINEIVGFRNRLIHAYLNVDNSTVWGIIESFIPVLHKEAKEALQKAEAKS